MGKKTKVGKQRKDKFYHLAKETGFRSRAAFKLLQLNRKFEFLQKSRVLVDLCAAPGGWMQVAVQNMPVSSLVIGVDLFPIKPIAGCISITEDITTPKCLQMLKKEMKTWKADVVLHDGAPNVGQNWIQDAYQQNVLTLSALKLATELLRQGGYFVTKVFRSKDYNSLIWVLQQLFRHVYSTKPAASRNESAEIFVVCKGYLAPNTIDPKFLDPKHAFEDVDLPQNKKQLQQLLQEVGKKKKPEGYPTGETLLYKPITASEFIQSSDHVELLANTSEILIDQEWIQQSPKTTEDIKDYCRDVKVLGKKEIKALIIWRKDLRDKWDQFMKLKEKSENGTQEVLEIPDVQEGSDTEMKLEDALESIKDNERREEKRKRKKLLKEVKKIQEKTSLDMIIPGDVGPTDTTEDSLFTLKAMKTMKDLEKVSVNPEMPDVESTEMDDDEEMEFYEEKRKRKVMPYDKAEEILDKSGKFYIKRDEEEEDKSDESEEEVDLSKGLGIDEEDDSVTNENVDLDELEEEELAPLVTDLDPSDKNVKRLRKAQKWFEKDIFKEIGELDGGEDFEINKLAESYIEKGAKVPGFERELASQKKADELEKLKKTVKDSTAKKESKKRKTDDDDLDVVSDPVASKKKKKLDVEGLALATVMVQSLKSKRDLMDEGWNRYAFNDSNLPDWFIEDEKKHMKKPLPVPDNLVEEYRNNLKEINTRSIKKVVEAKARKKKRAFKKMEKAKKKAEAILDKGELTDNEKASQIKQLYKKAKQTKKKEVTYVVTKKFNSAKRVKRPAGVKGPIRVVDPRMKKDLRKLKTMTKANKGKKGKKGNVPPKGRAKGRK